MKLALRPKFWPRGQNFGLNVGLGYVTLVLATASTVFSQPRTGGLNYNLGLVMGLRIKPLASTLASWPNVYPRGQHFGLKVSLSCLLYTSDAADE